MKKKGFTLIELLAVILILGIIALIAIPTVNKLIKDSRRGSWATAGTNMVKAAETYYQAEQLKGNYQNTVLNILTLTKITSGATPAAKITNLKDEISLKGKTPDFDKITVFSVDISGNALITFTADQFSCTNSTGGAGTEVKCTDV